MTKIRSLTAAILGWAPWAAAVFLAGAVALAEDHEGDPVRRAKLMQDCIADYAAKNSDGKSAKEIERQCRKAVANGDYEDPNITLDGMIKEDDDDGD